MMKCNALVALENQPLNANGTHSHGLTGCLRIQGPVQHKLEAGSNRNLDQVLVAVSFREVVKAARVVERNRAETGKKG